MQGQMPDPKEQLEAECQESAACLPFYKKLLECTERVEKNPETGETCTQELFDLTPCVDKCVIPLLT